MATVPQFGEPQTGLRHEDRPAAFGVLERDGLIAVVRVKKPGHAPWVDLPGGAIDPGEGPAQAMVREFGEETGLRVRAGEVVGRADQFFVNTEGDAYNNRQTLFAAHPVGDDAALKVEDDHTLDWMEPLEAIAALRHESHAWAVAAWLRRRAA